MIRRIFIFLIGLFVLSFGIALSIRANLGTTPVVSLPTVLAMATPISVGTYMIMVNLIFFLLQIILMGKKFPLNQFSQLPVTVMFGIFVDLCVYLTGWVDASTYLLQWVWVLVGIVLVAVGVYIEVQPKLSYTPADALNIILAGKTKNMSMGTVKILVDLTVVSLAVIASFALLGRLEGVREGTVAAALGVGFVIRIMGNIHRYYRAKKERLAD